ncbi:tRNA (Guanine37-N1) -methyltransferase (EC) [Candidatus Magnetomoraceae bacterium gMMP-13]
MKKLLNSNLHLALTHYPVINKQGKIIASAVTNLDLHDIARAAKTYGVKDFYVITPLEDQKGIIEKIVSHWTEGGGAEFNPIRREALELIEIKDSFDQVIQHINKLEGSFPKTVVTHAKPHPKNIGYKEFRKIIQRDEQFLLIFGTAWGLAPDFINKADYVLDPIFGSAEYNHLSVRSAASIILDRLVG